MVLTSDPQGSLSASGVPDVVDDATMTYTPRSVPRPTTLQHISWSTCSLAAAAYPLRTLALRATSAIVTAATSYAARHHQAATTSVVRYVTPRVVAALPLSPAPVRWTTVTSGPRIYGWNRFSRTWVSYLVRVTRHRIAVTKISQVPQTQVTTRSVPAGHRLGKS